MKTALVTGGSRGIGASIVEVFAKNGFCVYLNYNKSAEQAQKLQNLLTSQGFDVHLIKADVRNAHEVEAMLCHIQRFSKRLDVLVNNAGLALNSQIQYTTQQQFDSVVGVNIKGMFHATKFAVPLMLEKNSGSIVNISSIWGLVGASCESVYSMTKSASIGFSLALHKELFESGICVNCLCPPLVLTDMNKQLSECEVAELKAEIGVVEPSEVALEVFKLATDGKSGRVVKQQGTKTPL